MKLSVIIPCYNAEDTISTQLEALARQTYAEPWEVIVSDNGSTDNSMKVVEQFRNRLPNLRVIDSSDRPWRAHACNVGVRAATGESIAFCDADDEVAEGWVSAIGEAVISHNFVASRFDFDKLNSSSVAKIYEWHPQKRGLQKLSFPPFPLHAGGGGLGVKKSLHESIGGFDETLPRSQDTDYCIRIQLAGQELYFANNAVVHVRGREQYWRMFAQASKWAEQNVLMYKKYGCQQRYELWRWRVYASDCRALLNSLRNIRTKEERALFFWQLAWHIGKLKGSIRHGVAPV